MSISFSKSVVRTTFNLVRIPAVLFMEGLILSIGLPIVHFFIWVSEDDRSFWADLRKEQDAFMEESLQKIKQWWMEGLYGKSEQRNKF